MSSSGENYKPIGSLNATNSNHKKRRKIHQSQIKSIVLKNTVAANFTGLKKDFNPKIENMKGVPTRLHKSKSISSYTIVKFKTSSVKRNRKKLPGIK